MKINTKLFSVQLSVHYNEQQRHCIYIYHERATVPNHSARKARSENRQQTMWQQTAPGVSNDTKRHESGITTSTQCMAHNVQVVRTGGSQRQYGAVQTTDRTADTDRRHPATDGAHRWRPQTATDGAHRRPQMASTDGHRWRPQTATDGAHRVHHQTRPGSASERVAGKNVKTRCKHTHTTLSP